MLHQIQVPSNGYPSIEALCLKGGTFDPPSWPGAPPCVKTCTNFPPIRGMDPVDPSPVIGGKKREFKCRVQEKIPDSGSKVRFTNCLTRVIFID